MKNIFTFLLFSMLFLQSINAQEWILEHPLTINTAPTGVAFDANDDLLFISQGAGLFKVENGVQTLLSDAQENIDLTSFQIDDQDIWVGGYGGGGKFSNDAWQNFSPNGDLQGYAIYDVDVTNEDIWIAMENEGASHFNGTSWEHFNATNGILGQWHTCIAQSEFGEIVLGSNDFNNSIAYLNVYDGTNWVNIEIPGLMEVTSVFADSQNNLWVGGSGLLKYDGTSWTDYSSAIFDRNVISINEDDDGKIYFGMWNGGVGFVEGNTAILIDTEEGFTFKGRPNGIAFDAQGEVYFCMGPSNGQSSASYGIYRYGGEIEDPVSTSELEIVEAELFPNPVEGVFNIEAEQQINLVNIYSISGEIIQTEKPFTNKHVMNISNFPSGMYLVELVLGNEKLLRKMIKE